MFFYTFVFEMIAISVRFIFFAGCWGSVCVVRFIDIILQLNPEIDTVVVVDLWVCLVLIVYFGNIIV